MTWLYLEALWPRNFRPTGCDFTWFCQQPYPSRSRDAAGLNLLGAIQGQGVELLVTALESLVHLLLAGWRLGEGVLGKKHGDLMPCKDGKPHMICVSMGVRGCLGVGVVGANQWLCAVEKNEKATAYQMEREIEKSRTLNDTIPISVCSNTNSPCSSPNQILQGLWRHVPEPP